MKKQFFVIATVVALVLTAALAVAETDHTVHRMNYGNQTPGKSAHKEIVEGVMVTVTVRTMEEMGPEMAKGVMNTHHISVSFNAMETGKAITAGEVLLKVLSPDSREQTKDMAAKDGSFGAEFALAKQGKYGVMCRFKLPDGKVRSSKLVYEVK